MFCQPPPGQEFEDAPGVEERLQFYVDERVEKLRTELLELLESNRGLGATAAESGASTDAPCESVKKELSDLPADPFSANHLDQQDMHIIDPSIWDSVMLIGLDCIGPGESIAVMVLLLLNCVVQVYFCIIVLTGPMMENPFENNVLDELLRFRTSVAHKVENADRVSGRSLLSQVCTGEERLHISGTQRTMYEELTSFCETGLLLQMLALLCWSASMLAELNSTARFAMAVWQRKGATTRVSLQLEGAGESRFFIESFSSLDVAKVFALSTVPRLYITALLYVVGALYLSRTSRLEDLLLNAMALAFIMDVDDLLFSAFVPHRAKTLIQGLAPLQLTPLSRLRQTRFKRVNRIFGGSLDTLVRLLMLLLALTILYLIELRPFHGRLTQAVDILCSGDQDFVYGVNPASGMVVAARSAKPEGTWATAECVARQLASPSLREEFGWSPEGTECNETYLVRPADTPGKVWGPGAEFSRQDFEYVSSLALANVEQAIVNARCVDVTTDAFLTVLKDAVGGLVVPRDGLRLQCSDVRAVCHLENMTRVRALCPKTCECDLWGFSAAGLFKTPFYGCPDQCIVAAAAAEERWRFDGNYSLECLDFTRTAYYWPPVGPRPTTWDELSLMDRNMDGNITLAEVNLGFMRYIINERFWANIFLYDLDNDGVWDASEQSSFATAFEELKKLDNDGSGNLSAAQIQSMAAIPPTPTRISIPVEEGAVIFLIGLREYMLSRPNFRENLGAPVEVLGSYLNLTQEQKRGMFEHFASGAFIDSWSQGRWELGPDIMHPRGLIWCEFITSWEVNLLLGTSVCKHDLRASVRTFCPESCSCQAQMTDCPSSCPNVHKLGLALL